MSLPAPEPAQLEIPDELVTALVFQQFPMLAGRDIGRRYRSNDHISVRVGDDYGAIFPTLPGQDHLYARVAELLRPLRPRWRFPISAPTATGVPGHGYPYHWVLVPWVSASTAAFVPLHSESSVLLGSAIHEIHSRAPANAPTSPITSVTLRSLMPEWRSLLTAIGTAEAPENRMLDIDRAEAMFARAAAAAIDVAPTWTHGNIEPRSILSDRGRFAGILLWHQFGAGDPAADLGYAANLVPATQRDGMLRAYGRVSRDTAIRAQGWQLMSALRLIALGDPFLMRMAWERLIEFDLVTAG